MTLITFRIQLEVGNAGERRSPVGVFRILFGFQFVLCASPSGWARFGGGLSRVGRSINLLHGSGDRRGPIVRRNRGFGRRMPSLVCVRRKRGCDGSSRPRWHWGGCAGTRACRHTAQRCVQHVWRELQEDIQEKEGANKGRRMRGARCDSV